MGSPVLLPRVGPLVAVRSYLRDELAARSVVLPVGVTAPSGEPKRFALLQRLGSHDHSLFTTDYLIRVRVFDEDAVSAESNADLVYGLLLMARHRRIVVGPSHVWVSGSEHQLGPSVVDDPDVPLHGYQLAVFWTLALKPA